MNSTPPQLQRPARPQRPHGARGSAVVFMMLLMGVLIAGMVSSMGVLSGTQSQSAGVDLKRNAAFYAAEAGLQQAVWNMNSSPANWLAQCPYSAQLANGCTYTIFVIGTANWPTTPVTFRSVGLSADSSVSTQASITVTNTVIAPGIAIGGSMSDSGTLTINGGSVEVVGSITRSGTMQLVTVNGTPASTLETMGSVGSSANPSSGTLIVPSDVLLNGSIYASGTVEIAGNVQAGQTISPMPPSTVWKTTPTSITPNDSPNISITAPTVDTAGLIAQAQANGTVMFGGNFSNKSFDFTQSPNGIIYVNGNLSLSGTTTFKGTGTLVVQGTITAGAINSSSNPANANIVTTGNVSMSNSQYINGCLCVGGALVKSGSTVITGVVAVETNVTGSGNINLNYPLSPWAPPWFIHYTSTGGSNIQATNFSGATY